MPTAQITFTVAAPVECTDEQFVEWVRFELGEICDIERSNPLSECSLIIKEINSFKIIP